MGHAAELELAGFLRDLLGRSLGPQYRASHVATLLITPVQPWAIRCEARCAGCHHPSCGPVRRTPHLAGEHAGPAD